MATHPDNLRARLEDRADLLEATRLRYRALRGMLASFFWKERVRAQFELLLEVARTQPEVDATLAALKRRAAAEGWPERAAPVKLMRQVERLRDAVARAAFKRLPEADRPATLGEALLKLEETVLEAGPLLGRRIWARAVELLPRNLPELRAACAAAEVFEHVFKRPAPQGVLPFTVAEAEALQRALPLAEAALAALWRRLEHFDTRGQVKGFLQARVSRAPQRAPRSGPELLLHAAFWRGVAWARLRAVLEARLEPVVPTDAEVPALLVWLATREERLGRSVRGLQVRPGGAAPSAPEAPGLQPSTEGRAGDDSWRGWPSGHAGVSRPEMLGGVGADGAEEARLSACEAFGEGRAGLFELAAQLASLSRERPVGTWNEETAWARLWNAAQRARREQGEDVERLRDTLRLFILLRGQGQTPARLFSPERARVPTADAGADAGLGGKDLPTLVHAARAAAWRGR
ncbi:hypothetical protein [Corallococcus macrosporus]|uniref:Uncharacterized protein n=1 Tax=Myxococcus fulvus (strain ATCC BAA-855 / HW-1) TaxID=483219 RepID=F8CCQ8_MYXFH|nr:hypothetical protein [Corallococcus macrosporus]AEI63415.1 hypothetical protein LILAB_07510 [Corallococcus macrosporus]